MGSFAAVVVSAFLLFTVAETFGDRRPLRYQRGLICKPPCEIGVILLHDVEHRFLGEIAMMLGK